MTASARLYVKEWRLKRGLSQDELSERAGVRQATVSNLEGDPTSVRLTTLGRLAEALDVAPYQLLKPPVHASKA